MADFGSIAILVKLIGGADVIKQLTEIRKVGKELEKPINIQVAQDKVVVNAEKIAQATAKTALAQQRVATEVARTEAAQARAARITEQSAKNAERDDIRREQRAMNEANKMWAHQTKLAQQAQALREKDAKAYEQGVTKQAEGFQRAMLQVEQLQRAKQKAAEKDAARYQQDVEKQAMGFQRAIRQVDLDQQARAQARTAATMAMIGNISTGLNKVSGSWDRAMQGLVRFSDGLTHAGQVAATFAYRLTLITAPIDLLIAKSLQFTVGLEYSLAKVGTQLDGTLDQIQAFLAQSKALTLDLQVKYGVSPQQQSDALYYLVSSGVSQQQALAALDPLAKLSAVTQTSPGIASQALVATMNVFADELARFPNLTDRATYALEVMFDATRKGRFEFSDFATQFGRSAEQMHMANATFEETAAMLAVLSQVFTPSQASTTLNSFAKAFLNPIDKAKDAFEELQVSLYEMVGGKNVRRSFASVFAETFDELGKIASTDEKRANELMGDLFGDLRGGRGAQMLADPRNRQLLKDVLAEILSGTDNIGQAWELMAQQIQVVINQTIGMFYKLGDAVVKNLEPTIRGALAGIQVFFKSLTSSPQTAQILAQVGAALAVAAPAALVFATALMGAGGLLTAIATLMTPAYLIGFSLIAQALAPALTKAADATNAFGGGINGILATVTETARQLGLISDKDAFGILGQLGVEVDTAAYNSVKEFVVELRKLGDDASKIGNSIKSFAEGVGLLIKNIGEGKGLLGFFANIVKDVAGLGLGSINLSGSSGIATALDAVIGGMIVAKLGSMFAGALKFITTQVMHVTAGAVNIGGISPLSQTPFIGAGGVPVAGTKPGGLMATGASGLLVASIGAAISQKFFEDIKSNSFATNAFKIGDVANPFTSVIAGIVNEISRALTSQNFVDKIFAGASGNIGSAYSREKDTLLPRILAYSGNAVSHEPADLRQAKDNYSFAKATAVLDKEGFALAATFRAVGSAANTLASAAVSAAGKLASIAGMTVGQGYFAAPIVSADPNARYRALDTRYQNLYPDQMKAAELVFADRMKVADDNRAAAEKTKAALDKLADAAKEAANKLADAIKGLVSAALGETSVTEKEQERMDLQKEQAKLLARLNNDNLGRQQQKITESRLNEITVRLEQLGPYKDQPDEFARRTRAVATGTDPATYGQEYLDQLALAKSKMPNASLEDIAAAFGDKSLFAQMTPDEIDKMWNWDAVVDSVRRGINRIVGEWKLMKQAVGEVMSQLSSDEISALKEALGLGANTSLDSLAAKFLGKTTGLGAEGAAVGGALDPETVATFGGFADILERIKDTSNIVVKVAFDEKMWKTAQEAILEAEKFIIEKLLNYADVFIQITARFTEDRDNNNGGNNNNGGGGGTGTEGARATGGYVTDGVYRVGEQGYEYVIPHPIVKWMEGVLGGKITSPQEFKWLFESILTGGKGEAINRAELWASGRNGWGVEMPKNFAKWVDRIKVIVDDKKMSLDDALWQAGQPASGGGKSGGGGGGAATGGGTGSADISALKDSFGDLITALNHLTRSIDALARTGFQTPQQIADFGGGAGGRNTGGESKSETIIFNGDILAPNQATLDSIYKSVVENMRKQSRNRANMGMA